MGFSLYEIDRQILALVDPETGEIMDGAAFDQLQMAREDKLEGIACFIKNTAAEAAAIKAEEDALAARRKVLENRAERLRTYLADALAGEKFQTAKVSVTFRKSSRVEVGEPALAIAWAQANGYNGLVKYKAPEISKTDLGKLLKSGIEVPGAELVEGLSMGVK